MFGGHGAGQLTLGDQLAGIGMDQDVPDMLRAPDMNGFAGGSDKTGIDRAQVIGGDHGTDRIFFLEINAHERGKTPRRFRQNAGGAAMQNPVNLVRAAVDREPGFQKIRADLNEFQTQMVKDIIRRNQGFNFRNAVVFEPDHRVYASAFGA